MCEALSPLPVFSENSIATNQCYVPRVERSGMRAQRGSSDSEKVRRSPSN